MNLFSIKRSTWSTWPILLFNYNIQPWMTTKRHFIMIIPGLQSVTSTHFDVFLEPLSEELLELWDVGIETYDASTYGGSQYFNLCATLMWTMHDFQVPGIWNYLRPCHKGLFRVLHLRAWNVPQINCTCKECVGLYASKVFECGPHLENKRVCPLFQWRTIAQFATN